MKRPLINMLRLLIFLLPVLLSREYAAAQTGNSVYAGQTSLLSVQEIVGDTYIWELYTDVAGVNFATTPGNCSPADAHFVGPNTGPAVSVMWLNPGLYFYKVTAYGPTGCMNLKVGRMEVMQPLPTAAFIDPEPVCFGEIAVLTVTFTGTPPFSFTYNDGVNSHTVGNITDYTYDLILTPSTTTSYWITSVTDFYNVPNNVTVGPAMLVVNPLPEIITLFITNATDTQPNGVVEIIASGTALPLEYSLNGSNYQESNTFGGLMPGNYTVWVRDANGCIAKTQFVIQNIITGEVQLIAGAIQECRNSIVDIPVIAFGFTEITAFTLELQFDSDILMFLNVKNINPLLVNGFISNVTQKSGSLLVEFESPVPITIPPDERLFYIEFMGVGTGTSLLEWQSLQCVFMVMGGYPVPTIYTHGAVEIMPSPSLLVSGEGTYCEGHYLVLVAEQLDNQQITYQWYGPGNTRFDGPVWPLGDLAPYHSGNYRLVATNNFTCDTIIEFQVKVNPLPDVRILPANITCIGEGPILLETGIWYTAYRWQDGSTHSSFLATQEGEYWVEVTDANGCTNIAEVTLAPCEIELLVPNAFTPNGDGLNDTFGPIIPRIELKNYTMLIYNRWGQLLYETNDITKGWDGTFNGKLCSMDVYSYVITYQLPDNYPDQSPRRLMGSAMLLR